MTDTKTASGTCISPDGSLPAGNDLPDVTLIGAAVLDVLARPVTPEVFTEGSASVKETRIAFGGDALNEATVLSRLGKKVSLITRVGDDEAGAAILRQLRSLGISGEGISVIPGLRTAVNIVLVDEAGERYFLTDPGSSLRTLEPADILPKLEGAGKICCLASMFVSERLPFPEVTKLFRFLKDSGRTVCMDVTKRKHGETLSDLRALLSCVDILFANAEEASLLTGTADPAGSARMLREAGVRCAVVKTGKKGCIVCAEDAFFSVPAFPDARCVDTTGAGDTFAAAFLYAWSEGCSLTDCACFANAAASTAVEHTGAVDGVTDPDKILRRFRAVRELPASILPPSSDHS